MSYQLSGDDWVLKLPDTRIATGNPLSQNPLYLEYQAWLAEGNVPLQPDIAPGIAAIVQARIVREAQARLDGWAQSRGYDGILSACTYATSQIPRFAEDGQRAVALREQTWARLYEILDEVQAGTQPVPLSLAVIEADLPPLEDV